MAADDPSVADGFGTRGALLQRPACQVALGLDRRDARFRNGERPVGDKEILARYDITDVGESVLDENA